MDSQLVNIQSVRWAHMGLDLYDIGGLKES